MVSNGATSLAQLLTEADVANIIKNEVSGVTGLKKLYPKLDAGIGKSQANPWLRGLF